MSSDEGIDEVRKIAILLGSFTKSINRYHGSYEIFVQNMINMGDTRSIKDIKTSKELRKTFGTVIQILDKEIIPKLRTLGENK